MEIEEALGKILTTMKAASGRGIKPAIRRDGQDWVCTVDDRQRKSIIMAKQNELILVDMESKKNVPHIERVNVPEYDQQNTIERIQGAMKEAYGTLPTE